MESAHGPQALPDHEEKAQTMTGAGCSTEPERHPYATQAGSSTSKGGAVGASAEGTASSESTIAPPSPKRKRKQSNSEAVKPVRRSERSKR
jgi:hypothetical protein